MTYKIVNPEELQRIDRGEVNYADDEWTICYACNGAGEFPPISTWFNADTTCQVCKGKGEIPREVLTADE